MSFDDPDVIACAKSLERADPDRFTAVMAAPVAARHALFPIFAANVEIARAPWVTKEEMIAEMRLQWWRDIAEQISKGETVRRHEVATPLAAAISAEGGALLDQLIVARRWDIYKDPFEDQAAFDAYLMNTSGVLLQLACDALGEADPEVVSDLGYAHGLANFLRAIPALEEAKRVPLLDGRPEAVSALAAAGLERLYKARAGRTAISPDARPAVLCTWQTEAILKQARAEPHRVSEGALAMSGFRRSTRLMWQVQTGRW
ncbi:MAG: squalene/phytoene synthase family protein [Thalassovita sp.]